MRIVESNEDPLLYATGHVPGAVEVDWTRDLNDPVRRDYLDRERFRGPVARVWGITPETTVVFYGDKNNWWATYAFWVFQLFGHDKARVMDGGRLKWKQEGRELVREVPEPPRPTTRRRTRDDESVRVFRDRVLAHVEAGRKLIDVRSPEEYSGERLHMPDYPNEGALRGGHIPGAANVPWAGRSTPPTAPSETPTRCAEIYDGEAGSAGDDEVIVYCRIGERASHTWFVLTYLLGYERVRNYDGSWTEWGNLVGVPIER